LNGAPLRPSLGEFEKSGHSVATLRPQTVEQIAVNAR
jgi:hypothetical protein